MEIIERDSFTVIGIEVEAPWDELHEKMPKTWQEFKNRLDELSDRKSDVMMDISLDVTDGRYTQLIGVEVEKSAAVPDGMEKVEIPTQSYIYHQHEGDLSGIAESFGKMYDWAKEREIGTGEFKIDCGYRKDGTETEHALFIRVDRE